MTYVAVGVVWLALGMALGAAISTYRTRQYLKWRRAELERARVARDDDTVRRGLGGFDRGDVELVWLVTASAVFAVTMLVWVALDRGWL